MYFVARDVERDPPETGSESEALRDGDLAANERTYSPSGVSAYASNVMSRAHKIGAMCSISSDGDTLTEVAIRVGVVSDDTRAAFTAEWMQSDRHRYVKSRGICHRLCQSILVSCCLVRSAGGVVTV